MTPRSAHGLAWRKSSYSNGAGGNCVEVALSWRKSSYSNGNGGNCVEVAPAEEFTAVRDTKNRAAGHLTVPRDAWATFTRALR